MGFRFSGHESFACRYAWLPKALQAIQSNPDVFADEEKAMVRLGVGKNMVRSIRFWVEATGMATPVTRGSSLEPTALGRWIFGPRGFDPYLEDIQTLWLIHWNLSTHVNDPLFAWDFLVNRWQEPEFTESAVLKAFVREASAQDRKKTLSPVTLQQHFQVFLHTYVPTRGRKAEIAEDNLDCPLTELDLLVKVGEREVDAGRYTREDVYVYRREEKPGISAALFSYCLYDYWQKVSPNEKTLSVRSVATGAGGPGQVFKIPEEDIYRRLSDLREVTSGALRYQESTALQQVHRHEEVDKKRLLAQAYQ